MTVRQLIAELQVLQDLEGRDLTVYTFDVYFNVMLELGSPEVSTWHEFSDGGVSDTPETDPRFTTTPHTGVVL